MSEGDTFLSVAVEACRAAGRIQLAAFGESQQVIHKGEIDLVTEVDHRSEKVILRIITEAFPDHGVLAEESSRKTSDSDYLWVVDPLDGTTNYAHGFPFFCVSIALARRGEIIAGAVFNPLLNELFTARRGKGATLNGKPIQVSQQESLDQSFLATGFPYDIRRSRQNNLDNFVRLSTRCLAIRRAGAAALDLASVAAGRFDGFWELKLKPWDMAAGTLLVLEAGGSVTGLSGRALKLGARNIAASNGKIHREMLSLLRGTTPSEKHLKK